MAKSTLGVTGWDSTFFIIFGGPLAKLGKILCDRGSSMGGEERVFIFIRQQ
jgi:hypothetical protein